MLGLGIDALDSLLGGGVGPGLTEFYSPSWRLVYLLYHRVIVSLSAEAELHVVLSQEFGGLDPHLLRRIARRVGVPRTAVEAVLVRRAFRPEDVVLALESLSSRGWGALVVIDPYLHVDPSRMDGATPITSRLRRLSSMGPVVVFNRANGRRPHGGNFHHHSVGILVRLEPARGGAVFVLEKHPSRPPSSVWLPTGSLLGVVAWAGRPLPCAAL